MSERYGWKNSTYSYGENDTSYEERDSSCADPYKAASSGRRERRNTQESRGMGSRQSHTAHTDTSRTHSRSGYNGTVHREYSRHSNQARSRQRTQKGYHLSDRNKTGRKRTRRRRPHVGILFLFAAAVAVILIIIFHRMTSVPGGYETSTIIFNKNGSLEVNTVEEFDKDYYDASELEQTIDEAVSAYGNGVTKKKFEVRDGMAYLTMEYDTAEDYVSFNDTKIFEGTLSDAQADGYDLSGLISRPDLLDSDRIFAEKDLDELAGSTCIITEEQADVIVPLHVRFHTANLSLEDTGSRTLKAADTIDAEHPAIIILVE